MDFDTEKTISEIGQLNFSGNIIPHGWFNNITFPNKKPDLLGMMILAEIVYWYRPAEVKNEYTGQLSGYQKKFKADMLQRSLKSFANQFGVSKRRVSDALKRLEDQGLIIRELRNIDCEMGRLINVLFIAPVVERIADIQKTILPLLPSEPDDFDSDYFVPITRPVTFPSASTQNSQRASASYTSCNQFNTHLHSNGEGTTFERSTNTEITTQITTQTAAISYRLENSAAVDKKILADASPPNLPPLPRDYPAVENNIGSSLTANQSRRVISCAEQLAATINSTSEQLIQEISFVLLNPSSFTQASKDFAKKLNTICKSIRQGQWTSPILLKPKFAARIDKKPNIAQQRQHLITDILHWKNMLALAPAHQPREPLHAIINRARDALHAFDQEHGIVSSAKNTTNPGIEHSDGIDLSSIPYHTNNHNHYQGAIAHYG